ncbi:MAG: hypothetical protein ACYDEN_05125 [Acidimicrobiales bacterium]
MGIAVVGAGHVGLTTAACLAHRVTCADVDVRKVRALEERHVSIHEDGLDALVRSGLSARHDFLPRPPTRSRTPPTPSLPPR